MVNAAFAMGGEDRHRHVMPKGGPMTAAAPADPESAIAVGYASAAARPALAALLALDERLREIASGSGEPTLRLIRLVWWRDALATLRDGLPPGEPLLAALAGTHLDGEAMAAMVAGWEALVEDPDLSPDTVETYAVARGGGLFALAGTLLGSGAPVTRAGVGWAVVDAVRAGVVCRADALLGQAAPDLAVRVSWPVALRPIGQLAMLARRDCRRGAARLEPHGSRARLLRIAAFHMLGR